MFFNFHTLSQSLTPKRYYDASYHSEGLGISYHMSRYLKYQQRYDCFSTTGQSYGFSFPL